MAKKSSKPKIKVKETLCKYNITHQLKKTVLEVDFEGCSQDTSIENPRCRKGILSALKSNPNVDSVITSHYKETQYVGDSIEVMKNICQFIGTIDKISIRDSYQEFFGADQKRKDHNPGVCQRCPINPQTVFSGFAEDIMNDFVKAYESFGQAAAALQQFKSPKTECNKCSETLSQDMVYLFNQMEDLRARILHKGFNIVI